MLSVPYRDYTVRLRYIQKQRRPPPRIGNSTRDPAR